MRLAHAWCAFVCTYSLSTAAVPLSCPSWCVSIHFATHFSVHSQEGCRHACKPLCACVQSAAAKAAVWACIPVHSLGGFLSVAHNLAARGIRWLVVATAPSTTGARLLLGIPLSPMRLHACNLDGLLRLCDSVAPVPAGTSLVVAARSCVHMRCCGLKASRWASGKVCNCCVLAVLRQGLVVWRACCVSLCCAHGPQSGVPTH